MKAFRPIEKHLQRFIYNMSELKITQISYNLKCEYTSGKKWSRDLGNVQIIKLIKFQAEVLGTYSNRSPLFAFTKFL